MRKHLIRIQLLMLVLMALSGCGGGGGGGDAAPVVDTPDVNAPSRVSASADVSATEVEVGTSRNIVLSFTSKDGTSSTLRVDNLGTLPAGWSAAPGFAGCASVTSAVGDCRLALTYTPAAVTSGEQSLPLTFRYTDDEGGSQTGIFNLAYSAIRSNGTGSNMTMLCIEGAGYQCSGEMIRRENGVALTRSGVQVYGMSTQDDLEGGQISYGLEIGTGSNARADMRIRKSGGSASWVGLVLDNIGITWDGQRERPTIIETFDPTYGRNEIAAERINGRVNLPLPPDLTFYDWASKRTSATQSHYANNRYFPRDISAPGYELRCPDGDTDCTNAETSGISNDAFNGLNHTSAVREHEDGDIHAGDDLDGTDLPGGSGHGVPFPGSKGHRTLHNWSYSYANLTYWLSHDTVEISEWLLSPTCGGRSCVEHNQYRYGIVAFGDTTAPSSVPASGTMSYSGFVYGLHAASGTAEQDTFSGDARVIVNYASRTATVTINGIPGGAFTATISLRSGGDANYLTGPVNAAGWNGGLGARLFGPAAQEIAGTFSLSGAGGSAAIGGFVARTD